MRRRLEMALLFACALAVPACGGGDAGPTSTPPAPPTSSSTEASRPTTAPPVATPVDLDALRARPCSGITTAQQRELGFQVEPVEVPTADYGTCVWDQSEPDADGKQFGYILRVDTAVDPLDDAYRESDERTPTDDLTWGVFEPDTIANLPAVIRSLDDRTAQCEVIVGAGGGQGLSVKGVVSPPSPDLCDRLVQAAELAL
ncbi:MAG TPA: DUF3558 domain-containing protein [Actinophytocola sp.]|nr:DUF3558 domain-containing protein [Actinophytocola sp.]